jgi:hypothetical protein
MINPADPSKPAGGDGNEKYNPPQKRGPGEFDKTLEDAKKRFKEIAEEGRKQGDIKKQYWDINPPKSGGGGGASGIPKTGKKPYDFKKGGAVSSASKRADGCCIKGKTKGRRV